ncbi:MAG: hypothetical protein C4547_06730 [Phycisphaerales bacterium]|nr:MAG: hypothetical protein C4547_06730 [Phycisphaerales bacterium]
MRVTETVSAGKAKLGRDDALRLAREASKLVVSRGRKVTVFDMKREPPGDDELLRHLLGPTGNLRAPTVRCGKTLLVGFDEHSYRAYLTR